MNETPDELTPDEQELLAKHDVSLSVLHAHHEDCPRLEILAASQSGVLPEETARSVAGHVEKCSFCQILLKDLTSEELVAATAEEARRMHERVFATAKQRAKTAEAGGGFLPRWFWRTAPITAFAAALALVVWVRMHRPLTPFPPVATTMEEGTKSTIPSVLQWEKLPIKLQAQSILVWRGQPRTAQEKYASALTAALAYYNDENYAQAARQLGEVTKSFPDEVEAQLYMGVSQLKLDQNTDAIPHLLAAQRLGLDQFHDDATWYLALAYYRAGETQASLVELQELCGGKSRYVSRACSGVKELSGR